MKDKWLLFSSIAFLVIGTLAILSFIVLAVSGEIMNNWIVTLLLSVHLVVCGIRGIIQYPKG